jgi:hypothetical protein
MVRFRLTRLNRGAIIFLSCATIPSTSLTLLLSLWKMISSPARVSASLRPSLAIHSAHAQSAPDTSSMCTVCMGCLPGDQLERMIIRARSNGHEVRRNTHRVFMGFFRYPYTDPTTMTDETEYCRKSLLPISKIIATH